jgi:hypothetical protein
MGQTMQDLINQGASDQAQVTTDEATIAADQVKLTADQTTLTTDEVSQVTHSSQFDAALQQTGPVGSVSGDGLSVTIFAAAGAVIPANTPIPLASSVPVPAAPQVPATTS